MSNNINICSGLLQLNYAEIKSKITNQKLFGLDVLQQYLFRFCEAIITGNNSIASQLNFYDISPSVLLYGQPNTGKTTLCYLLFNQIKEEVTNDINFYTLNVGRMLDPSLGQSSRNLEQIFKELKTICIEGTSIFLLLDELDTFCMSRSRTQEHDAVRRAMTTLMLEMDQLKLERHLLLFGITNVPYLLDTAVVRRFAIKKSMNLNLSLDYFESYIDYLNKPLNLTLTKEEIDKIYDIYQRRSFSCGDIKGLYQTLFIDSLCTEKSVSMNQLLIKAFETGFSSGEHLQALSQELSQ
ncbi:ATP-binding protein [Nostoc sp. CMAA1605]|uniref:ATP-binding protein n=1 Tax=Nostoc sp. CMAA1605 TaxID=2055159 RepID=UPI001F2A599C|nr:ATP-binding protein [Nostoc sp. CMAA1605]MCF4968676.1 AAA family ATPase [Nostoc sp. CMAA1605]